MPSLSIKVVALVLFIAPAAVAQVHQHPTPRADGWTWSFDANVFFGYNHQQRPPGFADLFAWESQNWFMLDGRRAIGRGEVVFNGMVSLEPWTVGKWVYIGQPARNVDIGGSPQLFQTGESFILRVNGFDNRLPLRHAQHPHDLLMGLGIEYRSGPGRAVSYVGADLVGSPPLGPTAFMHRESARSNPQVPLTHHYMDSTHQSKGVVRAGVTIGDVTLEAGAFRGEGPDEHRIDIDRPKLDSYAARVGWRRGPWRAQFSGGHLHEPEWFEPYDVTRWTASLGFLGTVGGRPLAVTAGWGENRQFNGFQNVEDGYLIEWDLRVARPSTFYGRAEAAAKELTASVHPKGFSHAHYNYDIRTLTLGYVHELPFVHLTGLGAGADVTLYRIPTEIAPLYSGSRAYHVFLRWRPAVKGAPYAHH